MMCHAMLWESGFLSIQFEKLKIKNSVIQWT